MKPDALSIPAFEFHRAIAVQPIDILTPLGELLVQLLAARLMVVQRQRCVRRCDAASFWSSRVVLSQRHDGGGMGGRDIGDALKSRGKQARSMVPETADQLRDG